jgi:4-amino-4-deoxy-L-arabinose transferase-like glycosyltransferase
VQAVVQNGAGSASRRDTAIAFAILIAVTLLLGSVFVKPQRPHSDAIHYITYALNIERQGIFSLSSIDDAEIKPASSHAPLYPAWIAAFVALDGGLRDSLACVARNNVSQAPCTLDLRSIVAAQLVLAGVFIGCVWLLARRLSGSTLIAWLAALCALLARPPIYFANNLLTEALLMPLLGVFTVCITIAYQERRPGWMLAAGATLGLAALTRPGYAILFYAMTAVLAAFALVRWRRPLLLGCALFAVAYGIVVAPWLVRNKMQFDRFALTIGYDGNILAQRVAYNRMGWAEMGVAFIYWFPDFGDHLAAALFPERYYIKLGWDPGSYYATEARALYEKAETEAASNDALVPLLLRTEVWAHPIKHTLVSLPLAFRGIVISKYWGVVGLACFIWLVIRQLRRGDYTFLLLSLPIWFMVIFHAFISVSIPRYNLALIPYYAYAMALALYAAGGFIGSLWHRRAVVR